MPTRPNLALLALSLPVPALIACTDPPPTFVVAPATAEVATCRSLALTTAPATAVQWSVTGGGAIASTGVYQAPLVTPAGPVTALATAASGATASAALTVATAFPRALVVPQPAASTAVADTARLLAAHGARAYAVVQTHAAPFRVSLVRSEDGGATWAAPILIASHPGPAALEGQAIAIDAGNDDVVHVSLRVDAGDPAITRIADVGDRGAGSLVVLASSADGGRTFSQRPLYAGGNGDAALVELASPAPGVIVATASTPWIDADTGNAGQELLTWRDAGAGLGAGCWGSAPPGPVEHASRASVEIATILPEVTILNASGGALVHTQYHRVFSMTYAARTMISYQSVTIHGLSSYHRHVAVVPSAGGSGRAWLGGMVEYRARDLAKVPSVLSLARLPLAIAGPGAPADTHEARAARGLCWILCVCKHG